MRRLADVIPNLCIVLGIVALLGFPVVALGDSCSIDGVCSVNCTDPDQWAHCSDEDGSPACECRGVGAGEASNEYCSVTDSAGTSCVADCSNPPALCAVVAGIATCDCPNDEEVPEPGSGGAPW